MLQSILSPYFFDENISIDQVNILYIHNNLYQKIKI